MPQNSKRTTSTGKHPEWRQDRNAPYKKAARKATETIKHKEWYIILSSVKTCAEAQLNDGQGLETVWTSDAVTQHADKRCCAMRCMGDPENLQIAIELYSGPGKPFNELLFEEEIREGGYASVGVMAYEFTQRLRITCHKTDPAPKDTVWEVSFLMESATEVGRCKKGLRRLMNIASKMPEHLIFSKNFVDRQVGEDGRLTLERDNGFTVTFGGFLAAPEGRRLIGKSLPSDPPAIITRSGGASQKHSSAREQASEQADSEPTRPLTRAQKRADKKARKVARKQNKREQEHDSSPSAGDEEADKASDSHASDGESDLFADQGAE